MLNKLFILSILILMIGSCKKQEIRQYPLEIDFGYFPLQTGIWREFEVVFVNIDSPSNVNDTVKYFLREQFNDWFIDAAEDSALIIERFYRDSVHHNWKPLGVWQASIKNNEAHQVEENIRFVKLKFPVEENLSWNGDKYNRLDTLQQYKYTIASLNQAIELNNGQNFDSVLIVSQKDKLSLIDKLEYSEVYAYNIGLISKKQINIQQAEVPDDNSIPIENRVTKGTLYFQDIIAYGKN